MITAKLYIGTRRYSSWSLRGWLMVKLAGLRAEEIVIPIAGGATAALKEISPHAMVPYLEDGASRIWESLAIAEYCAEIEPALWPREPVARVYARSIAAEMHAGFRALRSAMPMNLGRKFSGAGQNPESLADIARIEAIWTEARTRFGGGPYLFGTAFTAADAMFAPVVARFLTYEPPLREESLDYCRAVRAHRLVEEWYERAAEEPLSWRLDKYEGIA